MDSEELLILLAANEVLDDDNSVIHTIMKNVCTESFNTTRKMLLCTSTLRDLHVWPDNYYEKCLPQYLNTDFYRMFRMSRNVFEKLLKRISKTLEIKIYHGGHMPVPQEKCLLVTLWYLGKGETLVSIADKFNLSESTVLRITEVYVEAIAQLASEYIKWPTMNECADIEERFRTIAGYPGVIGAVDGSHIPCKVPEKQQISYLNRKQSHSIVLQGICTADYVFTNIFVGFPGSVHDSRVFQNSGLFKNIERYTPNRFFYEDYHLLGDSAYFLREWLITPYIDNGRLTGAEIHHNSIHSRTRVVIENTFGRLKGRWRILHYVNVYSIKKVVLITTACCVLHNFTYLLKDTEWPEAYLDDSDNQPSCEPGSARLDNVQGSVKRNNIKNLLNANRT